MDSLQDYEKIAKNHEFALRGEFPTFGQPEVGRQRRVLRTISHLWSAIDQGAEESASHLGHSASIESRGGVRSTLLLEVLVVRL